MGRYAVAMRDFKNTQWDFTGDWAAGIKSGGVDGLVGTTADVTASTLSGVGQVVLSQRVEPIQGAVTFHCRASSDRDAGQVAADLRAAFSPIIGRENTLVVASPLGEAQARVRLSGPIADPVEDPSWDEMVLNLTVPLVADEGLWWMPEQSDTGNVTVTNRGDVPAWLKIRWNGDGGAVVLPSGARFALPAVAAPRTLFLSRQHSLVVRDDKGVVDKALWKRLRSALPEQVMPCATGRFILPTGATAVWREGVLDPWR